LVEGRITLLGDAFHPTLTFLGQGGVMSIEDGYILAACLDKCIETPATAFSRYEDIRKDRTATLVRKASENKESVFAPNLANKELIAEEVAERRHIRLRERMDGSTTTAPQPLPSEPVVSRRRRPCTKRSSILIGDRIEMTISRDGRHSGRRPACGVYAALCREVASKGALRPLGIAHAGMGFIRHAHHRFQSVAQSRSLEEMTASGRLCGGPLPAAVTTSMRGRLPAISEGSFPAILTSSRRTCRPPMGWRQPIVQTLLISTFALSWTLSPKNVASS
jgi:hypothetical protein